MWLLRLMHWSHLFNDHEIVQATAIWWMHDVEGGAFTYWSNGPHNPAQHHVGSMQNTALLGDNHGMFHQVGAVGPYDRGTVLVTPAAELAPDGDDWVVHDLGEEIYRAPLSGYRVSVLWKANVYTTAAERDDRAAHPLALKDVADVFNSDLEARGESIRLNEVQLQDPQTHALLTAIYPESVPVGAQPSALGS